MTSLRDALRSPMTWLVVLIAIAAVVVIAGSGDDDEAIDPDNLPAQTAAVEVTGTALPIFAEQDTAIGMTVPSVTATLRDGGMTEIGPDGTPRLIAFFAHWCPHCQAEVPVARDWLAHTDLPDGLEVIAVSTAVDPTADNYPPSAWFDREDWSTPVLLDDDNGSLAQAFGLRSFPFWVAVDADGSVVARAGSLDAAQLDAFAALVTDTAVTG